MAWTPIVHFEIEHIIGSLVDQVMAVASARLKTGAHYGGQLGATLIGVQRRVTP
jgi:hypothetical protein